MEYLLYSFLGMVGSIARLLLTGKGIIPLPHIITITDGSKHLNLGFLTPIGIGAVAGWLAPATLGINGIVSFMAGYSGSDIVENVVERYMDKVGKPKG